MSSIRTIGYSVDAKRLSPHQFGIPQIRERIFIVASRAGLPSIVWPRPDTRVRPSLQLILDDMPVDARPLSAVAVECLDVWQEFISRFPRDQLLPSFPVWSAEFGASYPFEETTPFALGEGRLRAFKGAHGTPMTELNGDSIWEALPPYARVPEARFPPWKVRFIEANRALYERNSHWLREWVPRVARFPPSLQKLEWNCQGAARDLWKHVIQFRASGVRIRRAESAPALVAMTTTQVPIVGWQRRYMTIRECARLQSMDGLKHLPSTSELAHKALGNAVNVDLAAKVVEGLLQDESPVQLGKHHGNRSAGPERTKRDSARKSRMSTINIRPGVSVLSVLRHLNYRPWYALAEFVDNSVQSFLNNKQRIQRVDGRAAQLRVEIELDPFDGGRLTVRDNAGGIAQADYARAFRAAEVPPDRTGLSEFGMGMKSAACWFSPQWTVRTKALDESHERTVTFDIRSIVRDSLEELEVRSRKADSEVHYTEIVLSQLYKPPQKRTLGKIKEHLAGMYRVFTREGLLKLTFDGEPLVYESPPILVAPSYKTPDAKPKQWRKDIDIDLGRRRRVHGFAALRETGSTTDAGFALFRRGRLIQGSADEGYRPDYIFGRSNSFVYQRLFGELHLEGFEVSHTKDGFRWEEDEEEFLELLKKELDAAPLPLLQQAREHRTKARREDLVAAATAVVLRTAEVIEREAPQVLDSIGGRESLERTTPPQHFREAATAAEREFTVEFGDTTWTITLELTTDPAVGPWVDIFDRPSKSGQLAHRHLGVRLALAHPFTERFAGPDQENLEPLLRIAAGIALAETVARIGGVKMAGAVRLHINDLLRNALSKA
jgi:site-specific DNA-cytosine methylase